MQNLSLKIHLFSCLINFVCNITYLMQVSAVVSQEQRVVRIGLDHFLVISPEAVPLGAAAAPATAGLPVLVHSSAGRSQLLPRLRPISGGFAAAGFVLHLGNPQRTEGARTLPAQRSHLWQDYVRLRSGAADATPRRLRIQWDGDGDGQAGWTGGGRGLDWDRTGTGSKKHGLHGWLLL